MEALVKREAGIPFSEDDLRTLVSDARAPKRKVHDVPIVPYRNLRSMRDIDAVLGPEGTCVIWFETGPSQGHWCSLIRTGPKVLEWFDPYGLKIDEELKLVPARVRPRTGQNYPYLSNLIFQSGYHVVSNEAKMQEFKKGVSSCGRFVGLRIALFQQGVKSLADFQALLAKGQKWSPDEFVTLLTVAIR